MFEVTCLDAYGNGINSFTQWDVDQKIVITLEGCDKNYLDIAPEVHFCNIKSKEALIVRSTVSNGNTITAFVPNILLQEHYPLLVYVYLTDSIDVSSQRTILKTEIPIRKRTKPSDYLYVENIERITAEMIKEEIERDTEETRTEAINAIQDTKNDAIALITQYENQITNTKNDAYSFITDTKNEAVKSIENAMNETEEYISAEKEQFEITAQGILDDTEQIKADTQTIYEDTASIADQTADKIESDIRTMMLENGMELKITSDGNGICTAAIVISQS